MAAPTIRQSAANSSGNGASSVTCTLGSAAVGGNLLVFLLAADKNAGTSFNLTGSGWTVEVAQPSSSVSQYLAWKVASGGETTITGTVGSTTSGMTGQLIELDAGGASSWLVVAKATNPTNETNITNPSTGTTGAASFDGRAIAFAAIDSASNVTGVTGWSGYTTLYTTPNVPTGTDGGCGGLYTAHAAVSAGASTGTTLTRSGSADQMSAGVVVFGVSATTKSASDSATGSETASVSSTTSKADAATGSEAIAIQRAGSTADAGTGAEALAVQRQSTLTDSATGSETAIDVTAIQYVTATDSATGTETIAVDIPELIDGGTDSATGSETLSVQSVATSADSATGSETLAVDSTTSAGTDSATATESLAVQRASGIADSATGSEVSTTIAGFPTVTDSATGSEDLAILRLSAVTDTAAGSEQLSAGPYVFDSATGSELITIVDIPFTQVLPLKLGLIYDLVVVARIPQASGPPIFLEVDPIEWKTLTITNTLSEPQELTATAQLSSLTDPVVQRLRDPDVLATELWLLRNGKKVFAGPLLGWQASGETVTVKAAGLLYYLKFWVVESDQKFVNADQFSIVKALIDQWQNTTDANFGIDTSNAGASGVLRTVDYLRDELHNVYQRVTDLGKLASGFDVEIDPATRQLQLWSPQKGVDRSTGEDAIVFDSRNVTSSDVVCSVAVGDIATDSFVTSKPAGADATLYATKSNAELRAKYGRVAITQTYSDVSQQSVLDSYAQGLIDARSQAFLIPGPKVRVTPDADLPDYSEGDTVSYELGGRLGVSGAFRIRKRVINVGSNGRETVDLEFV